MAVSIITLSLTVLSIMAFGLRVFSVMPLSIIAARLKMIAY
jgi:hypothetical protein